MKEGEGVRHVLFACSFMHTDAQESSFMHTDTQESSCAIVVQ